MTATMNRAVANRKKNNKGFSLVELIIVIAIMAILTALLAPQFLKYVERSRLSRDEANIALVQRTLQVALVDEETYRHASAAATGTPPNTTLIVTYKNNLATNATSASIIVGGSPDAGTNGVATELASILGETSSTNTVVVPQLVSTKYKGQKVTFTLKFDTTAGKEKFSIEKGDSAWS